VDPGQTVEHIERITQLILDICGTPATQCGPIDDIQASLPPAVPVTLRVARAVKVIGMPLTQAQCADALKRLGLSVTEGPGTLTVLPPSYRFDLQIEEDLIEEVVRMVGYEQLPATPPLAPISARIRPEAERSPFAVRRALAALDYQETINFSFVEERWEHELAGNANPIKLLNPIASQMSVMRSSLLGSLVQVLKFNLDRKASRVRVFELGRVFLRSPQTQSTDTTVAGFDQPMRVAGLAYGALDNLGWSRADRNVDFFDLKGDVQTLLAPLQALFEPATHPAMHPGRCASVSVFGRQIGFVGELHPQWRQGYELAQAPILFELELDAVLKRRVPQFSSVSKHQPVERDLAVIVSESVTHSALMTAINSAGISKLLRSATLFDVYRPQQAGASMQLGEKSLAVRLILSSDEATLTEDQIDAAVQAVLARLQIDLGARLRA
jgi:phenylalanyl-tRNA synthetase beta chain